MVSRLAQDKQPDHAIEILKYLRDNSGKKYHLTFVGKGDVNDEGYIKSIKNTIMTEDLNEYVSFVGWQENVFPFLTEANGFLMLSRKESFGYNVVEAMSVGLPIFSYDVEGGLIELHQNLVTGIMVNDNSPITLASKIDEVFDDLNLWREFSCKAKQKSKSFSIENMTSKTLDFYVEINKIK
jgi:glycosyltransferase involved in cell wall biosynthesis